MAGSDCAAVAPIVVQTDGATAEAAVAVVVAVAAGPVGPGVGIAAPSVAAAAGSPVSTTAKMRTVNADTGVAFPPLLPSILRRA